MLLIFWFLTSCSVGCRRSTELSTILGYVFLLILSLTASSESTFLDDFSWPAQIKACNRVNFIVHLIINSPRGVIWGVSHSFSSHFSSSSFPAFVLCFGFDDHVLWVLAFLPPTCCIEQRVSLLRPRATWPWGVWGWAAWQTRLCVLQYTKLSLWSWDLAGERSGTELHDVKLLLLLLSSSPSSSSTLSLFKKKGLAILEHRHPLGLNTGPRLKLCLPYRSVLC